MATLGCYSLATMAGTLKGVVTDQSGGYFFDSARVVVSSTNGGRQSEVVTHNGGRYVVDNLPAGDYTITIHYLGADSVEQNVSIADDESIELNIAIGEQVAYLENIIVIGQAASVLSAANQKHSADNIVSVVHADAIGQLPDDNVSEALQRMTGVFIQRDQGEGRFVGVRGLDPSLNVAKINGLTLPSPEGDVRNVALDVIPSDLVESLEITKTVTPDQDGNSIGGTIDIKSLSAFDRDGFSYKIKTEAYHNQLSRNGGYKYAASMVNVFSLAKGELGVALLGSSNKRRFATNVVEADGAWSDKKGVRYQKEFEWRDYAITRERDGLAINLDYITNANDHYYLRSMYSQFSDLELRNRIEFKLNKGDIVATENSLLSVDSEAQRELKDRYEVQSIYSVIMGGENTLDRWSLAYHAGYSRAEEDEPNRVDSQFVYDSVAAAGYSTLGAVPALNFSADAYELANYTLDKITIEDNNTRDKQTEAGIDISYSPRLYDQPSTIKWGVKFSQRDKTLDANAREFEAFDKVYDPILTLEGFSSGHLVNFSLGNFGSRVDTDLQRTYVEQAILSNRSCDIASYSDSACGLVLDTDNAILASARDYRMQEDISAVYLMNKIDHEAWRVVYGVRYEHTDFSAQGFNTKEVDVPGVEDIQIDPVSYDHQYSNWFPSINLRYQLNSHMLWRGAYSKTIARPSFGDLSPTPSKIEIEEDDGAVELKAKVGNPSLLPYEAHNIDVALNYFPESIGMIDIGIFYKRIEHFVFDADVSALVDPASYAGAIAVTEIEVFQPLNGSNADITGVEFSWAKHFHTLPQPFNGLLLMANATLTHSNAKFDNLSGVGRGSSALPMQSDKVGNLVVGYEKKGLSLRLSGAYAGGRLTQIDLADSTNDQYQDGHFQVDFSASYHVNKRLQLSFSVLNLNDQPQYRYYGSPQYNSRYEHIGRSYRLGLTYRNY